MDKDDLKSGFSVFESIKVSYGSEHQQSTKTTLSRKNIDDFNSNICLLRDISIRMSSGPRNLII
jgi:hypothetical protein